MLISLLPRAPSLCLFCRRPWAALTVSGGCIQHGSWVHQKCGWGELLVFTFGLTPLEAGSGTQGALISPQNAK